MEQVVNQLVTTWQDFIYTDYFRVAFTIFSIFFILFLIGVVRKRYFHFTMEGATAGFLFGVLFILVVETVTLVVFLFGGRTLEIIGGKKRPKEVVELTRERIARLNQVLGVSLCFQATPSATSILEQLPQLTKNEEEKVKAILCR